ncbi:hypothetical protein MSG28_014812 [Choristoneura fumiferana]|uniref:Uncharacterized protein n=1 Tax=Choristoneura fumiferana TaxID=7141 RepID=A0ACC0JT03_CHOFU|nr:hypothetical protein MSG28_014812 [Choristoneura fumiferana]
MKSSKDQLVFMNIGARTASLVSRRDHGVFRRGTVGAVDIQRDCGVRACDGEGGARGGECGVSEAAVAEGLYAGHEVKDEVVIGPETVQQQDVAFSMQNALEKRPCQPKIEGGVGADCTHTCPGDGPRCNRSPEQQHGLRSCFVRLERLPVGDLHRGKPCSSMQANPSASALRRSREQGQRPSCNLPTSLARYQPGALNWTEVDPCQLQPAGGAGAAPECTHTRPGEGPRCNMSHDQQFQLRSCSVRLERMPMEDLPRCDTCLVIFY